VLITAAAQGIGRASVLAFARAGATVPAGTVGEMTDDQLDAAFTLNVRAMDYTTGQVHIIDGGWTG